jgi:DNA-binding MarR family transcriptional regulator
VKRKDRLRKLKSSRIRRVKLKTTIFALNNILQAVEGSSELGDLDSESRAILKFVGANETTNNEVCVTDITKNASLGGSAVTLMRRLDKLQEQGWILASKSSLHHRRIRLTLSPKASKVLNTVSENLDSEIKSMLKRSNA